MIGIQLWLQIAHQTLVGARHETILGCGDGASGPRAHEVESGSVAVVRSSEFPKLPTSLTMSSASIPMESASMALLLTLGQVGSQGASDSTDRNIAASILSVSQAMTLKDTFSMIPTGGAIETITSVMGGQKVRNTMANWNRKYDEVCTVSLNKSVKESSQGKVQPKQSESTKSSQHPKSNRKYPSPMSSRKGSLQKVHPSIPLLLSSRTLC